MGLLDIGLVRSFNGEMQIPHVDTVRPNGGYIVIHLLEGHAPPLFYMGDTPIPELQRAMLGITEKTFVEESKKNPDDFKFLAPLLQPKDSILHR